jgi:hypothetical protein
MMCPQSGNQNLTAAQISDTKQILDFYLKMD